VTTAPLLTVIDETDDLLVVNKSAGLVCHPSKDGERSSLVGRVRLYLEHAEGRLVNRLDRETSGVVLIAKSASVAGELGKLLAAGRTVEKRYDAIVHGTVAAELVIDAPLGKDEHSEIAIKNCVRTDGAAARTDVRPIRALEHDGRAFSLLDVRPHTGRKHQIRIHLAHAGHPIVGDKLYGDDEQRYLRFVRRTLTPADLEALLLENHALHARHLSFEWRGRARRFECDAPEAFQGFLSG